MRIALVNQPWNPAVPPVETGSIAIWIYQSAIQLAATYDITVFAKRVRGEPIIRVISDVEYRRVGIHPSPNSILGRALSLVYNIPERQQFAQPGFYSGYRRRVARELRESPFDIVHTHNLMTYPAAFRDANRGTKSILHMHCEWLSQLPREVALELVEEVDQLMACSQYLADRINRHLGDPSKQCISVPNGVDTEQFRPPLGNDIVRREEREILFVGRISPEKGIHDLIRAFDAVSARFPDARLRIVGPYTATPREFIAQASDDPRVAGLDKWYSKDYLTTLKAMAGKRLGKSIVFHGGVLHSELPSLYQRATVLANPSISESFGMSLIEALACGCPVVATKAGGMPEIIADGTTGLLTEVGDEDELPGALIRLLGDPAQREFMARQGRDMVVDRYSWSRIGDRLVHLYSNLGNT